MRVKSQSGIAWLSLLCQAIGALNVRPHARKLFCASTLSQAGNSCLSSSPWTLCLHRIWSVGYNFTPSYHVNSCSCTIIIIIVVVVVVVVVVVIIIIIITVIIILCFLLF